MCALVLRETGLLPHVNPGVMTREEIAALREVIGQPGHHAGIDAASGCASRAACITARPTSSRRCGWRRSRLAGELAVPFTTGILIGIGETRDGAASRRCSAIRDLHARTATSRK